MASDGYEIKDLKLADIDSILDEIEEKDKQLDSNLNDNLVDWDEIIKQIRNENIGFIKSLISSNSININEQNSSNGMSLLMYAVVAGNMDLITTLLNFGIDINICDSDNDTAFDYSIKFGRYKITELLYYQRLSKLGKDLKHVATQIYNKDHEAAFFLKNVPIDYDSETGMEEKCEVVENMESILCAAITNKEPFSADILYYCWYSIINIYKISLKDTKRYAWVQDPLKSSLWKTMMKTYESILSNTKDKQGWDWIKKYFITSLIWYLPHPYLEKGNRSDELEEGYTDYINSDVDEKKEIEVEQVLKKTLFYELLKRVRTESKKQSDLLLKQKVDSMKSKSVDEWNALTTFNVNTQYSAIARQDLDIDGCLQPKFSVDDLSVKKYPPSTHFSAQKHYDTAIYLNELLFNANIMDKQFQRDMQSIVTDIKNDKDNNITDVSYRAGPVKTLARSQNKVENDYVNEKYPTAAKILDLNRCAIQFNAIDDMLQFIDIFIKKVQNKQAYGIIALVRVKNGWSIYNELYPSYTDIKLNVMFRYKINGVVTTLITEVQLLLGLMSSFKKKAHKLYSVQRQFEFVYNFAKLKDKMRSFSNNKDVNDVFIKLAKEDNIKQFTLLWSCIKPSHKTLTIKEIDNDNNDNGLMDDVSMVYILSNQHGKILKFLTNKENINIFYESIEFLVPAKLDYKRGMVAMIKRCPNDTQSKLRLVQNLYNSLSNNDKLRTQILTNVTDHHYNHDQMRSVGYRIIDWVAKNGEAEMMRLLLEYCDNENMTFQLLNGEEYPLYIACDSGQHEIVKCILEHKSLAKDEIHKLLFHKEGYQQETPLIAACQHEEAYIVDEILKNIDDEKEKHDLLFYQTIQNSKNPHNTAMHIAISYFNLDIVQKLIDHVDTYENKVKYLLKGNAREQTALIRAMTAEYDGIESMIDMLLSNLNNRSDKLKLIHAQDYKQRTCLFMLVELASDSPIIIKTLFKHIDYNIDDILKILSHTDSKGNSVFLNACVSDYNYIMVMEYINYIKSDTDKLNQLLLQKYNCDQTMSDTYRTNQSFLSVICNSDTRTNEKALLLRKIFAVIKNKKLLYDLLSHKDKFAQSQYNLENKPSITCLMHLTQIGGTSYDIECIEIILNTMNQFDKESFRKLICMTDDIKYNHFLLNICLDEKKDNNFSLFIKAIQIIKYDDVMMMLFQKDNAQNIDCIGAAEYAKRLNIKSFVKSFYEYSKLNNEEEKKDENINLCDEILISPCYLNKFAFVNNLMKKVNKDSATLQKILKFKIDSDHDKELTPFIIAVSNGNLEIVQCILNAIKNDKELMFAVLTHQTSTEQKSSLHYACINGYIEIVKLLLEFDEQNKLLFAIDKNGRTGLMEAADNERYEIVKLILNSIKDKNIKLKLIFHQDKYDENNVLLYTMKGWDSSPNLKIIQSIFDSINIYDDKIKYLFNVNNKGQSSIVLIGKYLREGQYDKSRLNEYYEIMKYLMNIIADENKRVEWLSLKSSDDKSPILMQICHHNRMLETIKVILNQFKIKESKTKLLNDVNGRNVTVYQRMKEGEHTELIVEYVKQFL